MNVTAKMSQRRRVLLVGAAAAAICVPVVSAATAATSTPPTTEQKVATTAAAAVHKQSRVYVGPSGNRVEVVDPGKSTYVPKIGKASAKDIAKAQRLLDGANKFCKTHSAKKLMANWSSGGMGKGMMGGMSMKGMAGMHHKSTEDPTHFFNPSKSKRVTAANPSAALIYKGHLDGVMINGKPLPYLGSIPRAHTHVKLIDHPVEMVHIYCTNSLKTAFTPNRVLGVKAAMIDLRNKIRPHVMDLNKRQLIEIRDMVRGFMGHKMSMPAVMFKGGPDPVLQAMRTEIRNGLMMLTEKQLRQVWRTMQSY